MLRGWGIAVQCVSGQRAGTAQQGARVWAVREWKPNDTGYEAAIIVSPPGESRSRGWWTVRAALHW